MVMYKISEAHLQMDEAALSQARGRRNAAIKAWLYKWDVLLMVLSLANIVAFSIGPASLIILLDLLVLVFLVGTIKTTKKVSPIPEEISNHFSKGGGINYQ